MIERNFNLHLTAGHSTALVINVNQFDQGEKWIFTLYNENGTQYIPSTGAIVGIKSDGLGIINSGSVVDGKVVIMETEQMTAAVGKAVFELMIDSQTHGTANFIVLVEPKPGNNADLSESDLSLLQEAIDATSPLPTGGSVGQVLTKTTSGSTWSNAGTPTQEQVADAVSDWADEHITVSTGVVIDTSLAVAGAAADSKKVGDEITDLKSVIEQSGGLTNDIKSALMNCFRHVAWKDNDPNASTYINALEEALYAVTAITLSNNSLSFTSLGATQQLTATTTPEGGSVTWSSSDTSVATVDQTGLVTSVAYGNATITATSGSVSATCSVVIAQATVTSISAVYTQSGTVLEDDSLDSLKSDLVVTATWSNQTTSTVASSDYTLSGTLTEGTSTITVSYGGKSTTFTVTVSAPFDYGVWTPTGSVITGYYLSEETGEPVAYSGCGYWAEYIDISAIREAFVVTSTNSNFRISLYTANGTFTRQYHPQGVPNNAQLIERTAAETQMRLSYYNNSAPTFSILECLDMPMVIGDISGTTGEEITGTNRMRSGFISVTGSTMAVAGRPTTVKFGNASNPWGTATGYFFRCYDSSQVFVGSLLNNNNVFTADISNKSLPTNTAYVRMEFQGNSLSSVEWTDYVEQAFLMDGTYYRLTEAS